jgi:hypothetical protein
MEDRMQIEAPVDLVQLGPDVAFAICQYLTRADCIRLSRCSKGLHQLLEKCCYLRLTQKQAAIVDKIRSMDNAQWQMERRKNLQGWHNSWTFPRENVVSTGTSTGKTAMALVAASCMVREGKPCMITVEDRLVPQWLDEWRKFERDLGLLPLIVPGGKRNPPLDFKPSTRAIVLVPQRWMNSRQMETSLIKWAAKVPWHAIICDELNTVPNFMRYHTSAFGITLNASVAGGSVAIADHATDEELGKLPVLEAHCYTVSKLGSPHAFNKTTPAERYQEEYARWTKLCAQGKTLILADDCLDRPPLTKRGSWITVNAAEYVRLEGTTHRFTANMNPEAKGKVITDFRAATTAAQAFLPASYSARGFNIPCDSLIVFDLNASLSYQLLLQMIGRVRRVQTSVRHVKVSLITRNPNLWKLLAALHRKSTSEILEYARHIESVDAFRALGLDIHADYCLKDALQHIWLEVRPGELPVAPPDLRPKQLELPQRLRKVGYFDHAVFEDYSALLCKKSTESRRKYWRLAIVACFANQIDDEPNSPVRIYRVYKEHTDKGPNSTPFKTINAAISAFNHIFMQETGNAWEGRANFCIHPDKYVFVSYNVNDPIATATTPVLSFVPDQTPKQKRDASPKRQ